MVNQIQIVAMKNVYFVKYSLEISFKTDEKILYSFDVLMITLIVLTLSQGFIIGFRKHMLLRSNIIKHTCSSMFIMTCNVIDLTGCLSNNEWIHQIKRRI